MTLFFFERIADQEFIGPVIIAAPEERGAWHLLARREGLDIVALRDLGWHVAQQLDSLPTRPALIYPSHYRRAIVC